MPDHRYPPGVMRGLVSMETAGSHWRLGQNGVFCYDPLFMGSLCLPC